MGKILFGVLIAVIVWVLFFFKSSRRKAGRTDAKSNERAKAANAANGRGEVESMVKCGRCGVFIPASESVNRDGVITCTNANVCAPQR